MVTTIIAIRIPISSLPLTYCFLVSLHKGEGFFSYRQFSLSFAYCLFVLITFIFSFRVRSTRRGQNRLIIIMIIDLQLMAFHYTVPGTHSLPLPSLGECQLKWILLGSYLPGESLLRMLCYYYETATLVHSLSLSQSFVQHWTMREEGMDERGKGVHYYWANKIPP